jgi:hypothetical protein
MWKTLFSENPPTFNKTYYVKRLAYRLQEIAHGVDGSRLDKRLSAMSERELDKPAGQRKRLEVHRLATGTRLMRENPMSDNSSPAASLPNRPKPCCAKMCKLPNGLFYT